MARYRGFALSGGVVAERCTVAAREPGKALPRLEHREPVVEPKHTVARAPEE
jgi:hypothetical protein